eukprot:1278621-Pyramimonas_sp.AAC.1
MSRRALAPPPLLGSGPAPGVCSSPAGIGPRSGNMLFPCWDRAPLREYAPPLLGLGPAPGICSSPPRDWLPARCLLYTSDAADDTPCVDL